MSGIWSSALAALSKASESVQESLNSPTSEHSGDGSPSDSANRSNSNDGNNISTDSSSTNPQEKKKSAENEGDGPPTSPSSLFDSTLSYFGALGANTSPPKPAEPHDAKESTDQQQPQGVQAGAGGEQDPSSPSLLDSTLSYFGSFGSPKTTADSSNRKTLDAADNQQHQQQQQPQPKPQQSSDSTATRNDGSYSSYLDFSGANNMMSSLSSLIASGDANDDMSPKVSPDKQTGPSSSAAASSSSTTSAHAASNSAAALDPTSAASYFGETLSYLTSSLSGDTSPTSPATSDNNNKTEQDVPRQSNDAAYGDSDPSRLLSQTLAFMGIGANNNGSHNDEDTEYDADAVINAGDRMGRPIVPPTRTPTTSPNPAHATNASANTGTHTAAVTKTIESSGWQVFADRHTNTNTTNTNTNSSSRHQQHESHSSGANADTSILYAGQSMRRCEPTPGDTDAPPPSTYGYCPGNSFHMRVGPKYERTKAKAPSPKELLEIVGIE
jgi:hypothetical protein